MSDWLTDCLPAWLNCSFIHSSNNTFFIIFINSSIHQSLRSTECHYWQHIFCHSILSSGLWSLSFEDQAQHEATDQRMLVKQKPSVSQILWCTVLSSGPDTPKVPLPVEASASPCNTCSLDPLDSAFQTALHLNWFSCFHTAHGRESLYLIVCIKMRLMCDLKIAINAIEKINHFSVLV